MRKLLIVDDTPEYARGLQDLFEGEGIATQVADTGAQGLELLAAGRHGVIFSDYNIGDMDGIAFLRGARSLQPASSRYLLSAGNGVEQAVREAGESLSEDGIALRAFRKSASVMELLDEAKRGFERYERRFNQHYTVIFVDDEASLARTWGRVASSAGYDAIALEDPREFSPALERCAAEGKTVAAVFTDTNMPHMDGTQVVRQALAYDPDISITIMSANRDLRGNPELYARLERDIGLRLTEDLSSPITLMDKPYDLDYIRRMVDTKVKQYRDLKK